MKVTLSELDWFKLQAAHGAIFVAEVQAQKQLAEARKQLAQPVEAKQQAFDVLLKALCKQHAFDTTKGVKWDNETHELIQD